MPEESNRRYAFDWSLLGDIKTARPNLGLNVRLEVYRLMQFCFRDVIERTYGREATDRVFYEAGELAGREFYKHAVNPKPNGFGALIAALQSQLKDLGIGILRVEEADATSLRFTLTVSEDLDCSGLPELGYQVCVYDEGFLAGVLREFTGMPFKVREVDCWCTGDRTCRFTAEADHA